MGSRGASDGSEGSEGKEAKENWLFIEHNELTENNKYLNKQPELKNTNKHKKSKNHLHQILVF